MSNLSPEEQRELEQLEAEEKSGWSASDDAELAALEAEFGSDSKPAYKIPEPVGSGSIADSIGSGLQGVSDFARQLPQKIPVISPLVQSGVAGLTAALDPNENYDDKMKQITSGVAARDEQSPIAGTLANAAGTGIGLAASPASTATGMLGLGTGLATSATDMALRSGLKNEEIPMGENLAWEAGAGLLGAGAGKAVGKLFDTDWYRGRAVDAVKSTLGGTKKELEKLDVRSDKLDKVANRLLDEDVFNDPFQKKQDIFNKISAKKAQSGETGGDLFAATAKPANQSQTYERLMARANVARNKGQKEIADKLEAEADIIKSIDSKPLGIEQPVIASPDQLKSINMQNTELDPEILKNRKTTLDKQAVAGTGDPAARETANEMRNMQYGLLDDDAASFLKAENERFGDLATADMLAGKSAAGDISNGGGLIGNVKKGMLSTAGAFIGNSMLPGGVGAAGGMAVGGYGAKLLQEHGSQLAAYGFNKASKVLQNEAWAKQLVDAGARGGTAGIGTAHFLLTQRDPEYRKTHQEDQDGSKNK